MVQNGKKFCLSRSISQEPYIIWLLFMVHLCKIIYPGYFFIFSKFWFFWMLGGLKGKKQSKMTKHSVSCSISQEPYIIWFSCMVQICKMIISLGAFFNFQILIFWVVRGLKGQKMTQFLSVAPCISGTVYHMMFIYGPHVCIKG